MCPQFLLFLHGSPQLPKPPNSCLAPSGTVASMCKQYQHKDYGYQGLTCHLQNTTVSQVATIFNEAFSSTEDHILRKRCSMIQRFLSPVASLPPSLLDPLYLEGQRPACLKVFGTEHTNL